MCGCGQALHVVSDVSAVPVLYLPCGHREQGADPLTSLNVPAWQALHPGPPPELVYPRLQEQWLSPGPEKPKSQEQFLMTVLPASLK